MKKHLSKALLTLLVVVILAGSFCTYAAAADEYKNCNSAYGAIIPTDSSLSAPKASYSFSGDSGVFYFMRISKGKPDAWFSVEIFSDAQYTTQIRSFKDQYSTTAGRKPLSVTWNFKTIPSGTYYGKCYTYYLDGENRVIDTNTLTTFKIDINRVGKREVPLKSLTSTANGPKITWETVPTALKYNVYRRAAGEKYWTYLKTVGEDVTSYVDPTAKSGNYYAYTVKCSDGKYTSLYNKKGIFTYYLAQPKLQPVAGVYSSGAAQIKWSKVEGASGYYIYRTGGSLSNYDWVKIATIKNGKTTSYVDSKATSTDWNYTYTVKAYFGKYVSSYDYVGVNYNYIKAPKITKVSSAYEGMEITWTANDPDIVGYYVYRKNGSSWKYLGSTTGKSFVDKTAVSNKTYTYTVKPYAKTNAGAFNKNGVSGKFLATPQLQPLTFDANYRGIIKWSKVDGATGYKVYRKVDDAKSWTLIAMIKNGNTTAYTDASAKRSGAKYTYTVRAYDSKNIHSWFVPAGISDICLAKPLYTVGQIATDDNSLAIEVTWGNINGATNYNVYKRVPGEAWVYLATGITETTFIDTTAESGVTYQYAVRARNDIGSMSWFYTKEATAVSVPTLVDAIVTQTGVSIEWTEVENASYIIYRAPIDSDEWEAIDTCDVTTYEDTTEGVMTASYKYSVAAVVNEFESVKSNVVTNTTDITADATFDEETKSIVITWDSPLVETIIITKVTGEEEPVELGVFSAELYTSIVDSAIEEGKEYTYTLTAISANKVNGVATASAKYPLPPLEAVTFQNIFADYNNGTPICTLEWSEVPFASEYIILRALYDSEEYTEVGSVKAEDGVDGVFTYVDEITEEISYKYVIKAVSEEDREPSQTEPTDKITVYKPLDALSDLVAICNVNPEGETENAITVILTWAPTENAESYIIQRKTEDNNYEILGHINIVEGQEHETTYVDETAIAGVQYTYKVTAVSTNRGSVNNTVDAYLEITE